MGLFLTPYPQLVDMSLCNTCKLVGDGHLLYISIATDGYWWVILSKACRVALTCNVNGDVAKHWPIYISIATGI